MKKTLFLLMAMTLTLAFTACGGGGETAETGDASGGDAAVESSTEETIVFKIAHVDTEEAPSHQMLLEVEKFVEEETDGAIDIQILANGIMGGDREILEAVELGTVQMTNISGSILSTYGDKFTIYDLPFFYRDFEALTDAYDGELGSVYDGWLEELDFMSYGVTTYGWKGITNNVKPIASPADMVGLDMRVMEVPLFVDTFKMLGANPTAMSWNEIYTGLQQGTIDAQDNPPELIYTGGFHEVQKYFTDTNHVQSYGLLLTKKSYIESLPQDIQDALREGFEGIIDSQRAASIDNQQIYLDKMIEEGIEYYELTDEERAVFIEQVRPVHETYRDIVGDEVYELMLTYSAQ